MEENGLEQLVISCLSSIKNKRFIEIWSFSKEIHEPIKDFPICRNLDKVCKELNHELSVMIVKYLFFPKGKGDIHIDDKMRQELDHKVRSFISEYLKSH